MNETTFDQLALLYLQHHHDTLSTAEEYVDEFCRVREIMTGHWKSKQPKTSVPKMIPPMPTKKSDWLGH